MTSTPDHHTQKILISDIEVPSIEKLLVMSYEPDLYLAKVVINGENHLVYRAPGEILKEFSQLHLKKHFKGLNIQRTYLIHNSAYDEMIGNPPSANTPLEFKIANPDDDFS